MGNIISVNIIRAVIIFFLQVLVLHAFSYGWIASYFYLNIMLYPLIIILLPMRTPQLAVLFIAFGLGLMTDMFYSSPGVHASASVATAFFRPMVLGRIEPREGYQLNVGPTHQRFGFSWFSQYAAILLFLHLLVYFAVETFAVALIPKILLKTIYTFIWSIIAVFLFNRPQ